MNKNIFLLGLIFAVSGCTSGQNYNNTLEAWQGQSVQYLYQNWGPPNSVSQLPNGGELITYNSQTIADIPPQVSLEDELSGAPSYANNPFFSSQENFFCNTIFTVNSGIITDYSYEGDYCNQ